MVSVQKIQEYVGFGDMKKHILDTRIPFGGRFRAATGIWAGRGRFRRPFLLILLWKSQQISRFRKKKSQKFFFRRKKKSLAKKKCL